MAKLEDIRFPLHASPRVLMYEHRRVLLLGRFTTEWAMGTFHPSKGHV